MTNLSDKGYSDLIQLIQLNGWFNEQTRVFLNGVANRESREALQIYYNDWIRPNLGEDIALDIDILLGNK